MIHRVNIEDWIRSRSPNFYSSQVNPWKECGKRFELCAVFSWFYKYKHNLFLYVNNWLFTRTRQKQVMTGIHEFTVSFGDIPATGVKSFFREHLQGGIVNSSRLGAMLKAQPQQPICRPFSRASGATIYFLPLHFISAPPKPVIQCY